MKSNRIVVHALAISAIVLSTFHAAAQIGRIVGKWNNDATGENIIITPDPVGGWQFWSSDFGQARITSTTVEGANVKVEGRGLTCYYHVTLTAGHHMNWQLRGGDKRCLSSIFSSAD